MAKRRRTVRAKRVPKVPYTLLTRADHPDAYARLDAIVGECHEDLGAAAIALAWCTSWRLDLDGKITLGRLRRASSLDRELMSWDLVVLLNRDYWEAEQTTDICRDALLDHELSHATTRDDPDTGEAMRDERNRVIYRLRKHDIEEFSGVVSRRGLWKKDLEVFAKAIAGSKAHPRLPLDPDQDNAPAAGVH
jgi:hypothetical protein